MNSSFPSLSDLGNRIGFAAAQHLDSTLRDLAVGPNVTKTADYLRLMSGEPHPLGNFAFLSGNDDPVILSEAIEPLNECQVPTFVMTTMEISDGVGRMLSNWGYTEVPALPALAVSIDKVPDVTLAPGYRMIEVSTPEEIDLWIDAVSVGSDFPRKIMEILRPPIPKPGADFDGTSIHVYSIYKGDLPVSASLLRIGEKVAGLYCVATLAHERGKGLGAFVTAEPLKRAAKFGIKTGVLQASPMGYPVYKRLGFEEVGKVSMYLRMPASFGSTT